VTESADWGVASGAGFTALVTAAARAVETRRPSPLVRDPYAEAFVLAAALPSPLPVTPEAADADPSFPWSMVGGYVAVRSRFFDGYFDAAVRGDAIRQVVILAAGLDTRAFRLEWPEGVTVYEVDAPLVLSFKETVLAGRGTRPRSVRRVIATDLREDWPAALRGAGFDPGRPTAWLAEGLFMYLTDEAKASLLAAVDALSASGSDLAVEHVASARTDVLSNVAFREAARRTDFDVDVDTLWPGETGYDPAEWLRASGWSADVSQVSEIAGAYGRALSPALPEAMHTALLITARKP
jgi:methyltransferase (TIGR00027 family)